MSPSQTATQSHPILSKKNLQPGRLRIMDPHANKTTPHGHTYQTSNNPAHYKMSMYTSKTLSIPYRADTKITVICCINFPQGGRHIPNQQPIQHPSQITDFLNKFRKGYATHSKKKVILGWALNTILRLIVLKPPR